MRKFIILCLTVSISHENNQYIEIKNTFFWEYGDKVDTLCNWIIKNGEKCDISKLLFSLSLFPSLVCDDDHIVEAFRLCATILAWGHFAPIFNFQFFIRCFIYNFQFWKGTIHYLLYSLSYVVSKIVSLSRKSQLIVKKSLGDPN